MKWTTKMVEYWNGGLIINCKCPTKLIVYLIYLNNDNDMLCLGN